MNMYVEKQSCVCVLCVSFFFFKFINKTPKNALEEEELPDAGHLAREHEAEKGRLPPAEAVDERVQEAAQRHEQRLPCVVIRFVGGN